MLALNIMVCSKKDLLRPEYYRQPAQNRSPCETALRRLRLSTFKPPALLSAAGPSFAAENKTLLSIYAHIT